MLTLSHFKETIPVRCVALDFFKNAVALKKTFFIVSLFKKFLIVLSGLLVVYPELNLFQFLGCKHTGSFYSAKTFA